MRKTLRTRLDRCVRTFDFGCHGVRSASGQLQLCTWAPSWFTTQEFSTVGSYMEGLKNTQGWVLAWGWYWSITTIALVSPNDIIQLEPCHCTMQARKKKSIDIAHSKTNTSTQLEDETFVIASLVPRLSWNANIYRAESLVSFVRNMT